MICSHCGTEYDNTPTEHTRPEFGVHTPWACRDSLKAQLASMTKRTEVAEAHERELRPIADDYLAAEAKLATAAKMLRAAREDLVEADYDVSEFDVEFRALGIDNHYNFHD